MSEVKFTRGPWKVGKYLGQGGWVVHMDVGDKGRGSDIVSGVSGLDNTERLANAHLIAAAPDLYAALKQMIEAMVRYEMDIAGEGDAPQRHRDLMRKARSALKKARGEND